MNHFKTLLITLISLATITFALSFKKLILGSSKVYCFPVHADVDLHKSCNDTDQPPYKRVDYPSTPVGAIKNPCYALATNKRPHDGSKAGRCPEIPLGSSSFVITEP